MNSRDFTLKIYEAYIKELINSGAEFLTFEAYMSSANIQNGRKVVLLRHDVDRKPLNALKMAKVEYLLGVKSTYYFRFRKSIFVPEIITQIRSLGHEIGYHYECLSDSNGDFDSAYQMFFENLNAFNKLVNVKTISMHGSPLKPYDNRDMWKSDDAKEKLKSNGVLGEVYLDIDYKNIAYVNDTGRNWSSGKSNRRDKVFSDIQADFPGSQALLNYFKHPDEKVVFQVHPERWSDSYIEWFLQYLKDIGINMAKRVVSTVVK